MCNEENGILTTLKQNLDQSQCVIVFKKMPFPFHLGKFIESLGGGDPPKHTILGKIKGPFEIWNEDIKRGQYSTRLLVITSEI